MRGGLSEGFDAAEENERAAQSSPRVRESHELRGLRPTLGVVPAEAGTHTALFIDGRT